MADSSNLYPSYASYVEHARQQEQHRRREEERRRQEQGLQEALQEATQAPHTHTTSEQTSAPADIPTDEQVDRQEEGVDSITIDDLGTQADQRIYGQSTARVVSEPAIDTEQVRSRQADLVDSTIFDNPINVVGCGAIGSFVVLTLAKMGFRDITVYDDDHVNTENISNQFYRYRDIGNHKARALYDMIHDFEHLEINIRNQRWDRNQRLHGYVIMAVDSMTVRAEIYQAIRRNSEVYGFIDGRMGGQQAEVYSVDLMQTEHKEIYEQYLWDENEASELPCTQKAVMYNVLWIASQIANNARLMMEEKPFPPVMQMDFENVNHINIQHNKE